MVRDARADPDPGVRLQALEAGWRLRDVESRDALIKGTLSQYNDDQLFAVQALAGPGDPAVKEHLIGRLTGEYAYINLAAARALGRLGDDAGYGVAAENLTSADPPRPPVRRPGPRRHRPPRRRPAAEAPPERPEPHHPPRRRPGDPAGRAVRHLAPQPRHYVPPGVPPQ